MQDAHDLSLIQQKICWGFAALKNASRMVCVQTVICKAILEIWCARVPESNASLSCFAF